MRGKIEKIYENGYMQRCPKCNRWIMDNFCVVHGDVKGITDFRIKAKMEGCNLILVFNGEENKNLNLKVGEEIEVKGYKLGRFYIVKSVKKYGGEKCHERL